MNCSCCCAGKDYNLCFLECSPVQSDLQWPEHIHSGVRKGRKSGCNSQTWYLAHQLIKGFSAQFPADDALAYNGLSHFLEPSNPKLPPCFMHQAFVAAVPTLLVHMTQKEDNQLMVSGFSYKCRREKQADILVSSDFPFCWKLH